MGPRSAALLLALLPATLAAQARDLKGYYREHCAVCHGLDGTGRGPTGLRLGGRNLADARWQARQDESALVATILKGRGAMPGFGRQLTEGDARRMVVEVLRPLASRRRP